MELQNDSELALPGTEQRIKKIKEMCNYLLNDVQLQEQEIAKIDKERILLDAEIKKMSNTLATSNREHLEIMDKILLLKIELALKHEELEPHKRLIKTAKTLQELVDQCKRAIA